MSNNTESISAKLRRWADDDYEGQYSPIAQARDTYGIDSTVTWQDLSDVFRKIADEVDAEKQALVDQLAQPFSIPTECVVQNIALGKGTHPLLEEAINRYFLPRPLYEDGEPVQFREEFADNSGDAHVLHEISYRDEIARGLGAPILLKATTASGMYDGVAYNLRNGERVKRPEPQVLLADGLPAKVGETVWHVDRGVEGAVKGFEYGRVLVRWKDATTSVYPKEPSELTHDKIVLDADSVPTEEGDTVWIVPGEHCGSYPLYRFNAGDKCEVIENTNAEHKPNGRICVMKESGFRGYPMPEQVTHREPDTQERIDEDAKKTVLNYWKCKDRCFECPSLIDGEMPSRHYGVSTCTVAQRLDLLRRQRELDGRDA